MGKEKATPRASFACASCGHREPKWLGRCPNCGTWNSFTEEAPPRPARAAGAPATAIPLAAVENAAGLRMDSGIAELNRVLGGGLMRGAAVLVGGEPGIGKSTLMLQAAARLVSPGRVLYVSGEESPAQLRLRAERIGAVRDRIEVLAETEIGSILKALDAVKPVLVLVDSIQTLFSREVGGQPGTPTQVRLATGELVDWARRRDAALLLAAHVTKEGLIAGPKLVEHLVDTVISFEQAGTEVRMLQAVKNRFGSVDEVGLFRMTEAGLAEVTDPAALFLVHREDGLPSGVAVAPVFEGSRVLLVEIQALVVPAKGGLSRIYSDRIDSGRAARVAAVLERHLGARFSELDLYVNVAGGIRIAEVGVELPLALALYSAKVGVPLPEHLAVTGEVSLAGEVRPVSGIEKRLKACQEAGFTPLVGPLASPEGTRGARPAPLDGLVAVPHVRDAVKAAFSREAPTGGAS